MVAMNRDRLRSEAWIGDAVLELFARERILAADGAMDGAKSARMTSNQFLSAFGDPTGIEAEVGRVYRDQGLHKAFEWIEENLVPLFDRQEGNRLRRRGRVAEG